MGKVLTKTPIDFTLISQKAEWYTIVTRFNYEHKFYNDFINGLNSYNFQDLVEDIFIPIKEYNVEYTNKKGIVTNKKIVDKVVSLYVFIKAQMTDRLYWYIRGITGCATILAVGETLSTLSDKEMLQIRKACLVKEKFINHQKVVSAVDPFINPIKALKGE